MVAMTYRPADELAERLRNAAFVTRQSRQAILDEALQDWLNTKGKAALAAYRAAQQEAAGR